MIAKILLARWKVNLFAFLAIVLIFTFLWGLEGYWLQDKSFMYARLYDLIKDTVVVSIAVIAAMNFLYISKEKTDRDIYRRDRHLANIVNASADGIISLDMSGKILSWNLGAAAIFGYSPNEMIGKSFDVLFGENVFVSNLKNLLDQRGVIKNYELEVTCKDKGKVKANLSFSLLRGIDGQGIGISIIVKDVTEKKLLEEKMQQSEKLIAIGQLAAGVAHEIFTPLNVISGNAEYILMGLDKSDSRVRELQTIICETDRIDRLIKRLMDFAKPQDLVLRKVDINRAVADVLDFARAHFLKSSITVETDLGRDLPEIMADESQLELALLNISINAWEAMPSGGKLLISTSLWVSDLDQKEYVRVKLTDTGFGIENEDLKRIFDPFFSTKDVGKGTGLGLTISYRVIEDHHGTIEVESNVNIGTTVKVTLPVRSG
ncbi:nitrogen regulation protein NR(II) [Candidatus Auribacterota bacterium]